MHPLVAFHQGNKNLWGSDFIFWKVSADLENHVAAIQLPTEQTPLYRFNICLRGPACIPLRGPAVLWLEHFAFSPSLSLHLYPTTANHCALHCLQLGPTWLCKIRQAVFSVQWSHLSTLSTHVCTTSQSSKDFQKSEIYGPHVFCRFFSIVPGATVKIQMANL